MKPIEMHVYVADEDGVAVQFKITGNEVEGAEIQVGFLENIDAISAASLLLLCAHAALNAPHGSDALANQVTEVLQQAQAILKVRMMRDENERTSPKRKRARVQPSTIDDDSEIPF